MIDLYKDNHVRPFANVFSSETIDWIFTKFHRNVPQIEVKNSLHRYRKIRPVEGYRRRLSASSLHSQRQVLSYES